MPGGRLLCNDLTDECQAKGYNWRGTKATKWNLHTAQILSRQVTLPYRIMLREL